MTAPIDSPGNPHRPDLAGTPQPPDTVTDAMRRLREMASSENTRAAHLADWTIYTRWCDATGHAPIPTTADQLAWFLTEKSTEIRPDGRWAYAPSTLSRWVSTINKMHSLAGHPKPGAHEAVRDLLRGLRRSRATPPARRTPLLTDDVRTIVGDMRTHASTWADRVAERRDTALLLLGLAGALRRSELTALQLADVVPHRADGLYVHIRRSKTDRNAAGRTVTLPYGTDPRTCPVCAYRRWREILDLWDTDGRSAVRDALTEPDTPTEEHCCRGLAAGVPTDGQRPLFRPVHHTGAIGPDALSGQSVHSMIQRRARRAGFSPELVATLGGHSLRAGFVTQAVRGGATTQTIMTQTGHADERMVALYSRHHAGLVGNAVTSLGL
ncbi:MAG: tyrosine-type recombinase/integrase [Rhodococcus sp.]|uniref:tyrosine-type recombinase/integrase n=1 Tax=Rhodococcus TaxID=1827 RepID=UPI0016B07FDD|nr:MULTISPECIES: tyrosine-type recombinase/integrase [Rhodococcus]NLV81229.1 tyrosine-type recombinase/integrase [Rhodococcus sp. (in: high G+C Gram-positive bacteria)]